MKRLPHKLFLVVFIIQILAGGWVWSETHTHAFHGFRASDPPRSYPPGGSGLQYPPNREMDVLHLRLDVTPDYGKRSVRGTATLRFKPIGKPLEELRLDGVELEVGQVTSTAGLRDWHASAEEVVIVFDAPVPVGQEVEVGVTYSAQPKRGLYFRTAEMGYPEGDTHVWTQGEPIEARHWFPSYDYPNEKFSTEMICHVPAGMVALSNGKLVSESPAGADGLATFHWLQEKPHVNYLITLVAGYFEKIEDTHNGIPMAFWTVPSDIAHARNSFEDTKAMMEYFEEDIGVEYPWAKYDQVCVLDFHWGGMENTSLTTLNNSTLHVDASETLRNSQGLVAHELAHQWFGDLLTCEDWSHLWLNEGFATYYEALFDGHKHGRDTLFYRMHRSAQGIIRQGNDIHAMVRRDYQRPEQQFSYLAYPKGSWILHMLRSQLGEDLYRRCIKTYVERHQYQTVETKDLMDVLEELSGRNFEQFFDQYVFHAHHPELKISYQWDARTRLAKMRVEQVQKLGDNVLLFRVPLRVRFKFKEGSRDEVLTVKDKAEDFYVPLEETPEIVLVDPDVELLAKVEFKPGQVMLRRQLQDAGDAMGRIRAAEGLGKAKDQGSVELLAKVLKEDSFWAVREEASQALKAIGSDEAFAALGESLDQPDARVRRRVLSDLASHYRETTYEILKAHYEREANPEIKAMLLGSLGAYHKPEMRDIILVALITDSFRHTLANAAIGAMKAQDDSAYVEPLLQYLRSKESNFASSRGFGRALGTLAYLGRELENKDILRAYLLKQTASLKQRVRTAAIRALGTLRDARAIAPLEALAAKGEDDPEKKAADQALKTLREMGGKDRSVDVGKLRGDVAELKKKNEAMQREFDALKKEIEAWKDSVKESREEKANKPEKVK